MLRRSVLYQLLFLKREFEKSLVVRKAPANR